MRVCGVWIVIFCEVKCWFKGEIIKIVFNFNVIIEFVVFNFKVVVNCIGYDVVVCIWWIVSC